MSVPDTTTFKLSDVVTEIGAGTGLTNCFSLATGLFDPAYEGTKDRLLNFRNYNHNPGPTLDPDAQAFLTAIGNTDPIIEQAINTLVLALKTALIWDKMYVIYPFVGETVESHAWNLKDTATFKGVFDAGVRHSENGIKGDGIASKMDTGFIVSTHLPPSVGISIGYYAENEETTGEDYPIGVSQGTSSVDVAEIALMYRRKTDNLSLLSCAANFPRSGDDRRRGDLLEGIGFLQSSATASGVIGGYHRDVGLGGWATEDLGWNGTSINGSIWIAGKNGLENWFHAQYSDKGCALAYIGSSLSSGDQFDWYEACEQFQTTLSRNV